MDSQDLQQDLNQQTSNKMEVDKNQDNIIEDHKSDNMDIDLDDKAQSIVVIEDVEKKKLENVMSENERFTNPS